MKALFIPYLIRFLRGAGPAGLVLALLLPLGLSPASAQGCTAFERELESWLRAYEPGYRVNVPRLERIRAQCTQPSDKLELIYYYLRAADALYQPERDLRLAYEEATHFYDLCATHFNFLVEAPTREEDFTAYFFARADALEEALYQTAQRLGLRPENRYYGETAAADMWRSQQAALQEGSHMRTRGQASEVSASFQKNLLRRGHYVSEAGGLMPFRGQTPTGTNLRVAADGTSLPEEYGYVGRVSDLTIWSYLAWNQNAPTAYPVAEEDPAPETARRAGPEPTYRSQAPNPSEESSVLVSTYERLSLHVAPGNNSPELATLGFGQIAYPVAGSQAIRSQDRTYISVRLPDGRTGWADRGGLVLDGHMAVLTRSQRGYPVSTDRTSDRGAILFDGGELVILADAREQNGIDWVLVVSRNAQKYAWIEGVERLSIEPLDLEIGQALYLASRQNSLFARKAQLEAIRQMPGYARSPLAAQVEQQLQQLYTTSR